MSFSVRAAIVIAAICAVSLAGSGTPGLALEPSQSSLSGPLALPSLSLPMSTGTNPVLPDSVPPVPETAAPAVSDADTSDVDARPSTLAALVAVQSVPQAMDSDLACLAGAIYFESKGEPLAGQLAVSQVIINRARSGRFPSAICSVVTQRGQFSFVRGGRIPAVSRTNPAYRTAVAVAQVAMARNWDGVANDALFFHARRVSPGWRLTRVAAIGGHIFYR